MIERRKNSQVGLTPVQIERRKNKVTGSTVATYLGFNPYGPPSDTWRKETGLVPFETSLILRLGQLLELGLATAYAEEIGTSIAEKPDSTVHPDYPWWLCHPDFICENGLGLEVKNHGGHMRNTYLGKPGARGEWDNDLVPLMYQIQCQWQMGAMPSHQEWRLVTYFGGDDLRGYRIKRDTRLIAALANSAHQFWKEHLDPDGPMSVPDDRNWQTRGAVVRTPQFDRHARLPASDLLSAPIPTWNGIVT